MQLQKQFKKIYFAFTAVILFSSTPLFNLKAQTVKLFADQAHSNVGFSVSLAGGLTRITGKYTDFDIILNYTDSDMTKSSIEANIKAASINTGIAGRDQHLATPDFFDATQFPSITFTSDSIVKNGNGFIAFGSFQMHGISKKIQLPFTVAGKDAKEGAIGFTARYTVKRSDYLIGKDTLKPTGDSFLSNDVMVELDFIAKLKKPGK